MGRSEAMAGDGYDGVVQVSRGVVDMITGDGCLGGLVRGEDDDESVRGGKGAALRGRTGGFGGDGRRPSRESTVEKGGGAGAGGDDVGGWG